MDEVEPAGVPGACKHTDYHLCSLNEDARVWTYECTECGVGWMIPVTDDDVPLITRSRGGRPLITVAK